MNDKQKRTLKIVLFSFWLSCCIIAQIIFLVLLTEDIYFLIPVFLFAIPEIFLIKGIKKNRSATNPNTPVAPYSNPIRTDMPQEAQTTPPVNNTVVNTAYNNTIAPNNVTPPDVTYKANAFREYFKTTVVGGLPVPTGAKCSLYLRSNEIYGKVAGVEFSIPQDRIISVMVDKSKEIQKQLVSSVGGAVAGGFMFGTLGAAIGGRAKSKNVVSKKTFLSIVYNSKDGEIKNIVLEPNQNEIYNLKTRLKAFNVNNNNANRIEL